MTTHSEEVLQAHDEGKSIHPTILQQAQIGPEYSETIDARVADVDPPPLKLFQTLNPHSKTPIHVSNEDYDEMLRKHAANRAGESNEPILSHIGEPRPAGSPR